MQITKRPLFYWILHRYRGLQITLLVVIIVSLFFRVYPLEMQKRIINIAIHLKKLDLLYLYCGLYMGAVIIAGLLKYLINMLQTWIGQKLLVEIRMELYQHILHLPLQFFRKTQPGTVITSLTAELNNIGFFLGGALAIPVTSVLTFFTFMGFMLYLNPLLGLLSMGVYPFEFAVIPFLQKRYNRLNKQRVNTTRTMANTVNEAISGIHEVHGNGSFEHEQEKLKGPINKLHTLLKKLFLVKYGIKFSNNLFQSFGPFLLFLVGGYQAIHGNFTIGALMAFLSAYEKVYDPWKEMIEYYQSYNDAQVRYKQIMTTFDRDQLQAREQKLLPAPPESDILTLAGSIRAKNIEYTLDKGICLLDQISFSLEQGHHLALVGFSGSGKSTLSLLIGQLYDYTSGSLTIDGLEINEMSKDTIAANIGFISQHPFIFTGTVRDNLLYACQALISAKNIDFRQLPSDQEVLDMVRVVGLEDDVISWGINSTIPRQQAEPMVTSFLQMRTIVRKELKDVFSRAIEFYDIHTFLNYSSIGTNILFGDYGKDFQLDQLADNPRFREFLITIGLEIELIDLGKNIAMSTVQLLGDLDGDVFFFQGSPMEAKELNHYQKICQKLSPSSEETLSAEDKTDLLQLALLFIPGRHKIGSITSKEKEHILTSRHAFLKDIIGISVADCLAGNCDQPNKISPFPVRVNCIEHTPYCPSQYLYSHSLLDNIIFGTVIDQDLISSELGELAINHFASQGLLNDIMTIGLNFEVGSKGDLLSGGQRQKIAIARVLLKQPPILIMDEATASLDNSAQAKIQRYIDTELKGSTTVISVMHRLDMVTDYEQIIVLKSGKIIETGNHQELMDKKGVFYGLVSDT